MKKVIRTPKGFNNKGIDIWYNLKSVGENENADTSTSSVELQNDEECDATKAEQS